MPYFVVFIRVLLAEVLRLRKILAHIPRHSVSFFIHFSLYSSVYTIFTVQSIHLLIHLYFRLLKIFILFNIGIILLIIAFAFINKSNITENFFAHIIHLYNFNYGAKRPLGSVFKSLQRFQ